MKSYISTVNKKIKDYYKILEPEYPTWLDEYINTNVMLKQQYVSVTCGATYSHLFDCDIFYSSLDHSIGVALIIWHFTHDKIQTLAGLFHDIATPVFKHSIDFLNGDYMTQEATEDLTTQMIQDSKELIALLKRDKIKLEEVDNYHNYPIADNDTPQLSADRLEYSLSNALLVYNLARLDEVREIYRDIIIGKNENNIEELSFQTKKIARNFVNITSKLSVIYREDRTRFSMQFLADIIKKMEEDKIITKKDLYLLKESEVIQLIEKSKYKDIFLIWKHAKKVQSSPIEPKQVYYVHHGAKIRYIDPLIEGKRISKVCKIAKKSIEKNLSYDMTQYVYIDNINFPNN